MLKRNVIQKFLMALGILVFLGTGFMAANIVTARPAQADCCTSNVEQCISPGSFVSAIGTVIADLMQALVLAEANIILELDTYLTLFGDAVDEQSQTAAKVIGDWFDTYWQEGLEPALKDMTSELIAVNAMQSTSVGMFKDAGDLNNLKRDFEKTDIKNLREQRPGENVAVAGTMAGGMERSALFHNDYTVSAQIEKVPRSGGAVGTKASTGAAADMSDRWENYVERYCRQEDNNNAAGCTTDGFFPGNDIDVAGIIFQKETIDTRDDDIKKSLDDLITNIAEPFVKNPVPASAVDNLGPAAQAAILQGESYKARRQLVYDSLYHVAARRVPGSMMGTWTGALRQAAGVVLGFISDNPSYNELMQATINERFRNGRYALDQVDEPENNQREMVIQQAFQLMQLSDQLEMMDHYSLLLAAQAGAEIGMQRPPGTASGSAPLK